MQSFHELLVRNPEYKAGGSSVRLVLLGGCRNKDDSARVESLQALAKDLDILVRSCLKYGRLLNSDAY